MSDALKIALAICVAGILFYFLTRKWLQANAKDAATPNILFSGIRPLFKDSQITKGQTIGSWKLVGKYKNDVFQLQTVVDTLSTRKLPILWLMVTLPSPQKISGTVDMMMRPAGPSTFSNFDFLPCTLQTPFGFPELAVLRTDNLETKSMLHLIQPHAALFMQSSAKELLVSPKGLRIVTMLAEAERARYGVFRQADFGDVRLASENVQKIMDSLITLHTKLDSYNA